MILKGAEAARYFAKPDPSKAGLLIFGADTMRVALRRQEAIAALIGPEGEAEMRLTRMAAGDLRRDPAMLLDALKAQGFFPGPRVAFLEEAGDAHAPAIAAALKDWRAGDAQLVVTAGSLTAKSALRKVFEPAPHCVCIGLYDDPPSREEIEDTLRRAGLRSIDPAAMTDLTTLARALDPGDFRQTVEKIGLYKHGDSAPLTSAEVALMAPATIEADLDDILHAAAEHRAAEISPLLRRLEGQGVQPVALCIAALRHFRILHAAASHPGGASEGIARMKPPVFGPRCDRMLRQASGWGMHRLEQALALLVDTDMTLRSASRAPHMAVMERALIRLSMMKR
ncbi:DNA polymerase III subunit delta [Falsirhodobacter sp. 20TX0035]|uniref:DNA polymerase III subunit delta n=1 Tax=Falsirhodobacter sp. 20TX0035 TaxID=3022019 RepID=UPI00232AD002|nr:DNA polymerase III subunit delta [Falsirhodobacter sp. 20TX0035]MDB6452556.1 DNA polymerase III subunit delta [Falsirhodobacter sp. 20TX0035]